MNVGTPVTVPSVEKAVEELQTRDATIVAEPFEVEAIGRKPAFFAAPRGNLFKIEEVVSLFSREGNASFLRRLPVRKLFDFAPAANGRIADCYRSISAGW